MATLPSQKVLIVDDDNRNVFALKAVLKSKGFDCLTAGSAQEGMNHLFNQKDIGVVLLDMMMPDMDGYEAIGEIRRSSSKDIPIISVTAQAMTGDRQKCIEAGADAYIPKPIDVDQLIILLHRYLK